MKTYQPKKPIYKEIDNIHELCRLCLGKAHDGYAIFKDDQDVCAAIALRIMVCVGLEIKQEQSLPNKICATCYEELEKYYKFRKKCQLSYQQLKYHILALKLKHQEQIEIPLEIPATETVAVPIYCRPDNVKKDGIIGEKETLAQLTMQQIEVIENVADKAVEMEVQVSSQPELSPDISTFLSTILMELGILSQEQGLLQHQGVSVVELETGDKELVLELVEEDEEPAQNTLEPQSPQKSEEPEETIIEVKPSPVITRCGKTARPWCAACGRAFSSRSALARHARGHGGARPHACPECGSRFAQKAVLQRHMLVHLDVRPHRCSLCSKSFTQRSALEAHARTHAPPHARPLALHRCTTCCKVFLYASGLSRHMMTHLGRVYECSACDKHFKDKSSLLRHLRTVCHMRPATTRHTTRDKTTEPAGED